MRTAIRQGGWVGLLGLLALAAGCVVPESVGYVPTLPGQGEVGSGGGGVSNSGGGGSGACVVDAECAAGQACCRGTCVGEGRCPESATCVSQGQLCEIGNGGSWEAQGDFYCARLGNGASAVCLERCVVPFSGDVCDAGSYCLQVGAGEEVLTLCVPGECQGSAECEGQSAAYGGTCLGFGNEASFCFAAGSAQEGEACDPAGSSPAVTCGSELFCVQGSETVCRRLCDLWSPLESRCGFGEVCGYLTAGQGACSVQTATGRRPFESCGPEFDWCDDRTACLDFGQEGESLIACVAYCRPAVPEDCAGPEFGDRSPVCQAVFVNGRGEAITDIGLCL